MNAAAIELMCVDRDQFDFQGDGHGSWQVCAGRSMAA